MWVDSESPSRKKGRRHGIASAHFMCPSKPKRCRHRAVAIAIIPVGGVFTFVPASSVSIRSSQTSRITSLSLTGAAANRSSASRSCSSRRNFF